MDRPIITRAEAMAAGLARYYTGKPCKHGHIELRNVKSGVCMECSRRFAESYAERNPHVGQAARAAYAARNPEKLKMRAAAYRIKNPEKRKETQAKYRSANREKVSAVNAAYRTNNAEKIKESSAVYRETNSEKVKKAKAAYKERNLEKVNASKTAWAKANPDKRAAFCRNRKALKRTAEGSHTAEDIKRIYKAQNGKCACCKTKVGKKYHVDHVIPLARGGSNWASNLQVLCPNCNVRKQAKDPITFMQSLGMLL